MDKKITRYISSVGIHHGAVVFEVRLPILLYREESHRNIVSGGFFGHQAHPSRPRYVLFIMGFSWYSTNAYFH